MQDLIKREQLIQKEKDAEHRLSEQVNTLPELIRQLRLSQERTNECISKIKGKVEELEFTESKLRYHVKMYENRVNDNLEKGEFLDIEYSEISKLKQHFFEVMAMLEEQIKVLEMMVKHDSKKKIKELSKVTKRARKSQNHAIKCLQKIEKDRLPKI
jgi:hypothetical protein